MSNQEFSANYDDFAGSNPINALEFFVDGLYGISGHGNGSQKVRHRSRRRVCYGQTVAKAYECTGSRD